MEIAENLAFHLYLDVIIFSHYIGPLFKEMIMAVLGQIMNGQA